MAVRTPNELAHAWRDALLAGDAVAFASLFAEDGVMIDVEHRTPDRSRSRPLEGRAEIERVTRRWLAETPDFEYEILELVSSGGTVAVRWRYAVGRSAAIELEGVSWLTCRDGEIVRADVYFDVYALLHETVGV